MRITRRRVIASGLLGAGAARLSPAAAAAATLPTTLPTTLGRTLVRGKPDARGWHRVVLAAGEPHVVRTGLGAHARPGRRRRRRALLAFAQFSDVHVVDCQSPARVEFTDRFDDQDSPGDPVTGVFPSAYRPHEMLTAHVAEAMVRAINAVRRGPVTGRPLAFAIQTGDNSDNSQRNEIRWNIDVLDGARVRPDSGDLTRFEGVADDDPTWYDTHYWHPHGTPSGLADDRPRSRWGFPTVPGLLDACRRPFRAQGLAMPWFTAFGNHDGLAQGNFPHTLPISQIATGAAKVMTLPPGLSQTDVLDLVRNDPDALVQALALSPGIRPVTADAERRLLTRAEIVEEHFTTIGTPVGHGFTATNRADGTAYYTFDRGVVRGIVLDTVNPNGYANGSLDATQFAWLTSVLARSADRLVIVFSHHTSSSMDNPLVATGADADQRVLGEEVLATLLAHECVIAWVNGHTHANQIWARPRSGGGGLWEINTASHIDWPQQSRLIEVVDNRDGTLSIFTTMLDHAGTLDHRRRTATPLQLAGLARELSANDWQGDLEAMRGDVRARNAELVVPAPAGYRPAA